MTRDQYQSQLNELELMKKDPAKQNDAQRRQKALIAEAEKEGYKVVKILGNYFVLNPDPTG